VACRIVLRGLDETAPVVLDRDGFGVSMSPDQQWVLSAPPWSPSELTLVATASEQRVPFELDGVEKISLANWAPDGNAVFLSGNTAGRPDRVYRLQFGPSYISRVC
jgi:hypothetical protein